MVDLCPSFSNFLFPSPSIFLSFSPVVFAFSAFSRSVSLHFEPGIRTRVVFLKVETNNTITFRFRLLKKQDIAVLVVCADDSQLRSRVFPSVRTSLLLLYLRPLLSSIRYRNSILKLDAGIIPTLEIVLTRTYVWHRKPICNQAKFQRFPVLILMSFEASYIDIIIKEKCERIKEEISMFICK